MRSRKLLGQWGARRWLKTDQVVQLVLLMKKLLSKILLSTMVWVEELLVEQQRWLVEVVDEIVVLEWTCCVEEVVGRPGRWTLQ